MLEAVDASVMSDGSLSDVELSSRYSSGIDSALKFRDDFDASGRMIAHGGASFIKSMQSCSPVCSHSSNFFATQGFWVHRIFEKYALQA
jgi:hypothetical protein